MEQVQCIAAIVANYQWRRVSIIYEDDIFNGVSGKLEILTEALQRIGSEIEHRLVLPPLIYLTNPEDYVHQEMMKLLETQSRAFIVLRLSTPMARYLFKQATNLGFMWRDSAWILSNEISNSLDSYESDVIASMEGALGLKSHYSDKSSPFVKFQNQFKRTYRLKYLHEDKTEPGMYALRAYDAVRLIVDTVRLTPVSNQTSKLMTLESLLSAKFSGLSGEITFTDGRLSTPSTFRVVNVIGKSYKELDFWQPRTGFSEQIFAGNLSFPNLISGRVNWPGGLVDRNPKGWSMPTKEKPLRIGVPGRTSFEKFVKVTLKGTTEHFDGFCIALFEEVKKILEENYSVEYTFMAYNGTYDDLVDHVTNKVHVHLKC